MKILHFDFDDLDSPTAGGQAVRTFEINRRLAKRGHDITVITLPYPGAQTIVKDGVRYERMGKAMTGEKNPWSFISYFLSIGIALQKHNYDLVVEDNIAPFTFGFSPLYTRKPVISQVQCFFAQQSSKKYRLPFWLFEKYGARFYKNFIVLTESMAAKIRPIAHKKAAIEVIPNGMSHIPKPSFDHQNYLLFLGRIDFFQKGLDYLIEVAKILKHTNPELKILIAGEGKDQARLIQLIHENKLTNVQYMGKIEGTQKEKTLRNCAALIQPSRFEIFPFTILEAAAYGKPTICFDIENLHEIMTKKIGVMTPAFDVQQYADATLQLLSNKKEYTQLSANAHAWAKEHLWDEIVKKQEKFYKKCLHSKS